MAQGNNSLSSELSQGQEEKPSFKLSSLMITNIWIISLIGLASILLLVLGDFEGKWVRVLSILALLGAFAVFSAFPGHRKDAPLSVPISSGGNIYMLVLGLCLIWLPRRDSLYDPAAMFVNAIGIIILVKAGVFAAQRISIAIASPHKPLSTIGIICATATGALVALLALPIAFYDADFGEVFWKLVVGLVLVGGLSASILCLLVWTYGRSELAAREVMNGDPARSGSHNYASPVQTANPPEASNPASLGEEPRRAPNLASFEDSNQMSFARPVAPLTFAAPVSAALPWPVFPNGQPLPAKRNGRPDFKALQEVARFYQQSDEQFFGD